MIVPYKRNKGRCSASLVQLYKNQNPCLTWAGIFKGFRPCSFKVSAYQRFVSVHCHEWTNKLHKLQLFQTHLRLKDYILPIFKFNSKKHRFFFLSTYPHSIDPEYLDRVQLLKPLSIAMGAQILRNLKSNDLKLKYSPCFLLKSPLIISYHNL